MLSYFLLLFAWWRYLFIAHAPTLPTTPRGTGNLSHFNNAACLPACLHGELVLCFCLAAVFQQNVCFCSRPTPLPLSLPGLLFLLLAGRRGDRHRHQRRWAVRGQVGFPPAQRDSPPRVPCGRVFLSEVRKDAGLRMYDR